MRKKTDPHNGHCFESRLRDACTLEDGTIDMEKYHEGLQLRWEAKKQKKVGGHAPS